MPKPKRTVEEICDDLLGQEIEGIGIDYDTETITITTSYGLIEFNGDGLEMYVESSRLDD